MGDVSVGTAPIDFDREYVARLKEQLRRVVRASEHTAGLAVVTQQIVDAIKGEERKRGRRRIRQPGCGNVAGYGWRRPASIRRTAAEPAPALRHASDPCELLSLALEDIAADRIFQAEELLQRAEGALRGIQASDPSHPARSVAAEFETRKVKHGPSLEQLRGKLAKADRVREGLCPSKACKTLKSSNGIRTSYRNEGQGWHTCIIEGTVEAPAFQIVSLLREADLWTRWMPRILGYGVAAAAPIDVVDRTNLSVLTSLRLPWPLSNREIAIGVECVDAMDCDTKQLLVLFSDAPAPPTSGVVRCSIKDSGCVLTPYYKGDPNVTYCQFLIKLDMCIEFVPSLVLDGTFSNMSYLLLQQVRLAVKLVSDDAWSERYCHPHSPFYVWLRRRVQESLPEQGSALPPLRHGERRQPLQGMDMLMARHAAGVAAVTAVTAATAAAAFQLQAAVACAERALAARESSVGSIGGVAAP